MINHLKLPIIQNMTEINVELPEWFINGNGIKSIATSTITSNQELTNQLHKPMK